MADTSAKPGSIGWLVWHPADLPQGYHTAPRGHAWQSPPAVGRGGAPREPRGRATPGGRDATRLPARKIISGCRHPKHRDIRHAIARATPNSIATRQTVGPEAPPDGGCPACHLTRPVVPDPPCHELFIDRPCEMASCELYSALQKEAMPAQDTVPTPS